MKITNEIAMAAVTLLQPYAERELTVEIIKKMLEEEFLPESAQETLLTRKETAVALHVSLPTIDRMLRDGELVACRIRGRVMFRQSAVDGILKA
jgi:excisionase family DNA binding protein